MTKRGRKLHKSHLKSLKEKLSGYGKDPYTFGYAINLLREEKIDKNI